MTELTMTIVEGWHLRDGDLDLDDVRWGFALGQRHFGPRQLLVATFRADGTLIGLAHCDQTDPPMMGLKCCLATLDDGAAVAIAYSDEAVTSEPPPDLEQRFEAAVEAAEEFGVELEDWIMCDDLAFRSIRESVGG